MLALASSASLNRMSHVRRSHPMLRAAVDILFVKSERDWSKGKRTHSKLGCIMFRPLDKKPAARSVIRHCRIYASLSRAALRASDIT
jgi:hypothetical protein